MKKSFLSPFQFAAVAAFLLIVILFQLPASSLAVDFRTYYGPTLDMFSIHPAPRNVASPMVVFSNTTAMTIADRLNASPPGVSSLYPSVIEVSGLSGTISDVNVTITGITTPRPRDLDFLLVSPGGQTLTLISDVGGTLCLTSNLNLTIDDSAGTLVPDLTGGGCPPDTPIVSGTYRPTNVQFGVEVDTFPLDAPQVAYNHPAPAGAATLASAFNGLNPNGTWSLYVVDDALGGGPSSISGGWSIDITTAAADAGTTTTIASSLNPSQTGQNVTFTSTTTSGGNPVTLGTVSFTQNSVAIAGCTNVALNGAGQAVCATNALAEGTRNIVASYNGATGFGISSGSLTQVINSPTVVTGALFCNNGGFTIADPGPGSVYPSNISVTGLLGTVSNVRVRLNSLTAARPSNLDFLLVGPGGQAFQFMSDTGDAVNAVNAIDLIVDDAAASQFPIGSALSGGTYRPTDFNAAGETDPYPAPAPASFVRPAPAGVATFASVYANTGPNGNWALYSVDDGIGGGTSTLTSWCVDFTVVPLGTTTSVTSSLNPSNLGQLVTFTATVSSTGGTPTGNVQFFDGATPIGGPVALNGSGQATVSTSSLTVGPHTITAQYAGAAVGAGGGGFAASSGALTGNPQVVTASADLSITKTDSPDPVLAGNDITYTINVSNAGPNAALNTLVSDSTPANTTFVSASGPGGWSIVHPGTGNTGPVTFTNASFVVGGPVSLTLVVKVNAGFGGTITNTATISSDATDPGPGANTAMTTTTSIICAPPPTGMVAWWTGDGNARDIAGGNDGTLEGGATYGVGKVGQAFDLNGTTQWIERVDTTGMDTNGSAFSFDAWIYREGKLNVSEWEGLIVKMKDGTPSSQDSFGVFIHDTGTPGPTQDSFFVTYDGNLFFNTPNGSVPAINTWFHYAQTYDGANIRVYVDGTLIATHPFVGRAASSGPLYIGSRGAQHSFNGLIDEVEVFDKVLSLAEIQAIVNADAGGKCKPSDLNIVKTDGGVTAVPGGTITYTLNYANHGEPATGVVISETVPANTTFTSLGSTPGWSCADGSAAGTNCTLNVGNLGTNAGASATFVVTVINPVPAGVTQTSNTASISDGTTELDTADNTSTDTTPITAQPDLSLTKSDGGVSVAPGGTVAYTLTYANNGNQGATGVVLTETVPLNTTFNAGPSTAGWGCAPDNNAGSSCTLAVGAVAGGGGSGSATFAVTVINPVAAGVNQISNTASVADDGTNGADATPANNIASDTTPVDAAPDLTISKSDGGASVVPGGTVTYTLNYSNAGNQGATGVVITETVPSNTTFNAGGSTGGWVCVPDGSAGSICTFNVGALNAGGNGSVTFAVTLPTTGLLGVTEISNTATIADDGANGADPTPANNTSTDTTPRDCQAITVNNPVNDTGLLGTPFSETFTQTGGFGTLTYTLASGTLPNGITLSTAGVLSGTPAQSGMFPITVTVTDENGCQGTSVTYNLEITCNVDPIVLNSSDSGVDSLRYAVATACPGSTITFDMNTVVSPIPLSTGEIPINKNLTIQGPGANLLTVSGGLPAVTASRIFYTGGMIDVEIIGLTLSGGNGVGAILSGRGGAIHNSGADLDITSSVITSNVAFVGGAIVNDSGIVTLTNSTLSFNTATQNGGAYWDAGSARTTLNVVNSTINGNLASGASGSAGGIDSVGTVNITNSTISGNSKPNGIGTNGGGILQVGGVLTITNSTITDNSAGGADSAGGVLRSGGTVTVRSSIIAANQNNATTPDVGGAFTSQGYNLIGNVGTATGFTNAVNEDQVGTGAAVLNPLLGALANNGGPTETHALLPTSPAVDQGINPLALQFDQRGTGFARTFDILGPANHAADGTDIGAYELNTIPTTTTLTSSGSPSVFGETVTFTATVETDPASATVVTGNVDFFDGVSTIAGCQDVALVSNQAQCVISTLSVGAHTIMAEFDENLPFLASSDTIAHQVNKADTTTAVGSSNNPSVFGESVTFTATVAASAPGSGTPTGTVTFTVDGNPTCVNVALNGAGQAACTPAGPLSVGNHPVSVTYSGDTNYNASAGSLPTQVVNKANTTIQITGDTPDPTLVGEPYTVTWQVTVVAPGAGVPTGTVTVTDGTDSCMAAVAAGSCVMTSTTVGIKNLVATYSGDGNFNGSVSAAAQHTVNIKISGNVRHFPGMNGIAGITVTLTGANGGSVFTGVDGYYEFVGVFTGDYTVTPSGPVPGKSYDPISRSFTNVLASISGVDFVAYDTSEDAPRKLRVVSQNVLPGSAVVVPIVITAQGNETSVEFSIEYDPAQFAGPPTVACGSGAGVSCTLVTDYSQPGRVGIKVTPMDGTFAAGEREVVRLTFQTLNTLAADTPVDLIGSPTNLTVTDANGDPLLVELMSGFIIYQTLPAQEGLEGDVAARFTGDGQVLSNDVILVRQMAVGLITPNAAFNEFQRADSAPRATLGDGQITTGDVIQTRRYGAGIDPPTPAGGPFGPMMAEPPPAMLSAGETVREVRVMRARGVAGERVTIPVEMKTTGDEMAVSFTLEYDARKLTGPTVTLAGGAPADAVLTVNDKVSGRLTILIDAGTPFSAAGGQLVNVTFDAAQTAPAGDTAITITSVSVADANANEMSAAYASGTVTIDNANAPGVRISGRVLTPTRGGLSNAQVTITDAQGARRTVLTSSAGYYQFDSVAAGRRYSISVSSRRYRFTPRAIEASADLTNVDIIAQE